MPSGSFTASAFIVGGRQRHHRERDHFGTEEDSVVVLSAAIGKYPAGMTVADMLADLVDRLGSLEAGTHRVSSFTANAFIQPTFRADAVLKRTMSGSFTANAVISKGGRLTADAVIRQTMPATHNGTTVGTSTRSFGFTGSQQQVAQSFSPAVSGSLRRVRVAISKWDAPADNAVIEIQSGSTSAPNGTVLATVATVPGSSLTEGVLTYVEAEVNINVVAGTTYWIVFHRSGALDSVTGYAAARSANDDEATGGLYSYNGTTWSVVFASPDAFFSAEILTGSFTANAVIV